MKRIAAGESVQLRNLMPIFAKNSLLIGLELSLNKMPWQSEQDV